MICGKQTETVNAGRIINVTIPTGLSQPYSYSFKLNEPAGLHFLATMYDAKGFGTGGTTGVLREIALKVCGITLTRRRRSGLVRRYVMPRQVSKILVSPLIAFSNLLYDFFFSIDPQTNPSQCSSMVVSWNDNVTYPLNLYGLVPSGTAFNIPVPQQKGSSGIGWPVDISSGTQFLLFMSDTGEHQTGGSTSLLTVGSGNTNCMNSTSPRAFGSGGGSGNTGSSGGNIDGIGGSSSGGTDDNGSGGGSNPHTGAIVGGVLGGVAFLVLLAILLWFCVRRNSKNKNASAIRSYGFSKEKPARESRGPLDLLVPARHNSDESQTTAGLGEGRAYTPMPFRYPSPEARDSPNSTPLGGSTTHNFAGASAALAGMNEKHLAGQHSPILPMHHDAALPHPAYASSGRPSSEDRSGETGATNPSTGTGLTPSTDPRNTNRSSLPPGAATPSAWQGHESGQTSEMGSENATVGLVARNGSTRKAPVGHSPHIPQASLEHGVHDSPGGTRPLPEVPTQFVQHEDSGRIV